MGIRIVIDGIVYDFEDYSELRELLDERASSVGETKEANGVYFP